MTSSTFSRLRDLATRRPALSPLALALAASLFFTLACNGSFLAAMQAHGGSGPGAVFFVAMSAVAITALQFFLLALFVNRWTAKPLLALLLLLTASTVYFMRKFHVYMDVAMVRNVLETDWKETQELLAWDMLPHLLLWFVLPLALLLRVDIVRRPLRACWWHRPAAMLAALLVAAASLAAISQTMVPLMREHRELRYLVTPSNDLYSLGRIAFSTGRHARQERMPVGTDAHLEPEPQHKPALVVLVVGETVRAANWGLDGYARQTTPGLATRGVFNFRNVESCGTNTETSLPCMFSANGRHDYDEDVIANSETLLDVLAHAGVKVIWRENQSGCKGVCAGAGIAVESTTQPALAPDLCADGRCFDEILLRGLPAEIAASPGDTLIVLHMLGNHGPAYFQRYPPQFRQWTPTCDTTELGQCTQQQVVNAYDNAVLYTDHVLSQAIDLLNRYASQREVALLYVSDHGESLGEKGLYLHSLPRAIAPDTQTHVPMVLWLPPQYLSIEHIDPACLARRTTEPASHDNLFSTVLGLFDVRTQVYTPSLDLAGACRAHR